MPRCGRRSTCGAVGDALESAVVARRTPEAGWSPKPRQIVVAAMRKLLVICFGVLKTGKPFDPAIAMPA